ncbi:MAG: permease-like cell division protein FtsX [Paludibacteraceae bacterium]|jgi:cell division transport system permease protein|nr:permease-like cell division protein FtsX [Paludibacteraceae bacterium]MED9996619.1 permease-like cell division protein FtsX [Paludibacteraceae bacterium]
MKNKSNIAASNLFNSRLTSIISISLVLFLIGTTTLIILLTNELSVYVRENLTLSIVLKDNVKPADIQKLQKSLDACPYTNTTEYIDKETAAKELAEELGQDPTDFLGYNPLLGSLEMTLKSDYANNDSIAVIEKSLQKLPEVKEIIYQKDLIDTINTNVRRISVILLGLSALLLLISYALISNTVRLSVYAKRFLIHTMKLVGATGAFIRKPFLMQGAVTGLIAAILAMGLLSGILFVLRTEISQLLSIESMNALLVSFIVMLISGVAITTFATYLSVTRYLRLRIDDMYYI